eukprot:443484-Pelagomonas_calceolata.AAC.3
MEFLVALTQAEAEEKRQELESNILQLRSQLQEKQQAPDSMVGKSEAHARVAWDQSVECRHLWNHS